MVYPFIRATITKYHKLRGLEIYLTVLVAESPDHFVGRAGSF